MMHRSLNTAKKPKPLKPFYAYVLFDDGDKPLPHDVVYSWIEVEARQKLMPGINYQRIRCIPAGKVTRGKW